MSVLSPNGVEKAKKYLLGKPAFMRMDPVKITFPTPS
jgi:hypothetical protein